MTFPIVLGLCMIVSLLTMFIGNFQGNIGAVILGFNTVGFDYLWQWLRMKLMTQQKTSYLLWAILGGLAARIISIYLFIRLSLWWLGNGKANQSFYIYAILLMTIPIWNIIAAFKLKLKGTK